MDRAGWRAALTLGFAPDGAGGTALAARSHVGPLVVQRPFFPEGRTVPHVYLLHPPGGLVGGDDLTIDVSVGRQAHALDTTPAATKVYRTRGPLAAQRQRLRVEPGGALEWLPQELILHDGCAARLETEVRLAPGARFVGVDALCFGLPARGETFATGRCRQRFEVWREDATGTTRPVVIERGRFDASDPVHAAAWGLGGARVHALFVAAPVLPEVAALMPLLRAAGDRLPAPDKGGVTIVSPQGPQGASEGGALVGRYLGASTERARHYLQELWTLIRPALLGRPATPPRIWAT